MCTCSTAGDLRRRTRAELSEPVQPIVYWLDKNIPKKYRASVTAGILEWNKAFEKIGFKTPLRPASSPTMPTGTTWTQCTPGALFTGADVGFYRPAPGDPHRRDSGCRHRHERRLWPARRFFRDDVASRCVQEALTSEQRLGV